MPDPPSRPTLVINLPHPNPHPSAASPDISRYLPMSQKKKIPTLIPTCIDSTSSNPRTPSPEARYAPTARTLPRTLDPRALSPQARCG